MHMSRAKLGDSQKAVVSEPHNTVYVREKQYSSNKMEGLVAWANREVS